MPKMTNLQMFENPEMRFYGTQHIVINRLLVINHSIGLNLNVYIMVIAHFNGRLYRPIYIYILVH